MRLSNQELDCLVMQAQNGDTAAVERVIIELEPEIKYKIASSGLFVQGMEKEDLEQNARIVVFKAIEQFKHDKGSANFRHFALKLCVHRNLLSEIGASQRKGASILNEGVSLDATITSYDGDSHGTTMIDSIPDKNTDIEEEFIEKERIKELNEMLIPCLTELEKNSYLLYIQKMSYREISIKLNTTEKTVDNALARVRNKARKLIAEDEYYDD